MIPLLINIQGSEILVNMLHRHRHIMIVLEREQLLCLGGKEKHRKSPLSSLMAAWLLASVVGRPAKQTKCGHKFVHPLSYWKQKCASRWNKKRENYDEPRCEIAQKKTLGSAQKCITGRPKQQRNRELQFFSLCWDANSKTLTSWLLALD